MRGDRVEPHGQCRGAQDGNAAGEIGRSQIGVGRRVEEIDRPGGHARAAWRGATVAERATVSPAKHSSAETPKVVTEGSSDNSQRSSKVSRTRVRRRDKIPLGLRTDRDDRRRGLRNIAYYYDHHHEAGRQCGKGATAPLRVAQTLPKHCIVSA